MNYPNDNQQDDNNDDNHFFDVDTLEDDDLGAYSGSHLFTYLGIEDRIPVANSNSSNYSC
jgi:hypothetical protein